jgi:hypothetical protein
MAVTASGQSHANAAAIAQEVREITDDPLV